jgi:WD40 repeat protein
MNQELKSYKIKEEIGEGGFGKVYRAYQPLIEREVAIKAILPIHASQPDFIRRFEAEAHLIARLEHPHIVPLYDYWRDPTGAYLVMRWLRGGNLLELMEKTSGSLDLEKIAKLLDQITDALSIAHQHDVVHQDIKPENILLDEHGNAYLSDFGIAQDLRTGLNLAKEEGSNVIHGSPAYISPEHLLQDRVTSRSDIYSVGLLLYEMLTGQKPWKTTDSTTSREFLRHRFSIVQLPALQDSKPNLPKGLNDVIWQATARKPTDRYTDITEMARDFYLCIQQDYYPVTSPATEIATINAEKSTTAVIRHRPRQPINPYKGLHAFQEADADDFFGRDDLIKQLKTRLEEESPFARFLAVIGPSGSGKSSAVKAGLIPAIRNNEVEGLEDPFIAQITPGTNPLRELEGAILQVATRADEALIISLSTGHYKLSEIIEQALPPDDDSQFILFIDQFEEVFTLVKDEDTRKDFLEKIVEAVTAPNSRARVIVTLRADYYDRPLMYPRLGDLLQKRTEIVLPLSETDLRNVIQGPAERTGLVLEEGLIDAILSDIGQRANTLPLLQYTLTELYERRDSFTLTLAAYTGIGGISGALAQRAEEIYLEFDEDHQEATRQIFLRLINLSDRSEGTRSRALQSELQSLHDKKSVAQKVMDTFGRYRLLTFDNDPETRMPTVEIAHEAIILSWERFHKWLEDSKNDLRLQANLNQIAKEWIANNRNSDYLATGTRLAQLEPLINSNSLMLIQVEQEFLDASVVRQQHINKRRQQRIAVLAVITVVAVIFAVAAFFLKLQADDARVDEARAKKIARANELAASALVYMDSLDLSLLLSSEALEILDTIKDVKASETFEARNSLLTGLQSEPRLEAFLHGHTDWIRSVAYNSDGSLLASGSQDGTIIIWDTDTNQSVGKPLAGHTDWVTTVAFSPDGHLLASGSRDATIIIWDVETGEMVGEPLTGHDGEVRSIAFNPDGTILASAGIDHTVRLWNIETGTLESQLNGHEDEVYTLAFSSDGSILASAGADTTILLWHKDTTGSWESKALTENTNWVLSVAFSPDGSILASGGADNSIHVWNVANVAEASHMGALTGHNNWIRSLDFNTDGDRLVSADANGLVAIWDSVNWQFLDSFVNIQQTEIRSVVFSPDTPIIAIGGQSNAITLWHLEESFALGQPLLNHTEQVLSTAFHPSKPILATAGGLENAEGNDAVIRLWDTTTKDVLKTLDGHSQFVSALTFNPSEPSQLASASHDRRVIIWNIDEGEVIGTIEIDNSLDALAYNPNGQIIALGSNDNKVYLWSVAGTPDEWHQIGVLEGHTQRILSLAFRPDGNMIASTSRDGTIRLWDVNTQQLIGTPLTGHSEAVTTSTFSPDGTLLASGSRDNTIRLWDAVTGGSVSDPLIAHEHWIRDIAFSPDGQILASASSDNTIILWDVSRRRPLGEPFEGHTDWVNALTFSADGNFFASGGGDGLVVLWTVGLDLWRDKACVIANRNFTTDEIDLYLRDETPLLNCMNASTLNVEP